MTTDLHRRVRKLERAATDAIPPDPVRVILGTLGESEGQARARLGVPDDERVIFVDVTDARRDGLRRETN